VLENIPNMVFVKDAQDLRFVRFNKAGEKLLGHTKKELIGKNDYDFFPKEQADFFTEKDNAVLRQNDIVDVPEEPIDTKQGQRWLHTKKIPILSPAGRATYLLGISEDITDIRDAKLALEQKTKELERSNSELEQFAYVASHDLQEPLRTISSYVQLLASRYKDKLDKDANEFIDFAVDGSKRMRTLINSLLEYSRVNRVKPFEWMELTDLMKEIQLDMKDQIKEANASIKYNGLPKIYGDVVLINQLFQNLIGNAIKFRGEKKPEVKITSKRKNGEYIFSVEDNGIGIKDEYAEKIFVIFQRLNSRDKYPGTGIGLSICKKIVERHGGKIWVESEPGKGAKFYFTIKAA
jgi:PAS domain S-box-containing protein